MNNQLRLKDLGRMQFGFLSPGTAWKDWKSMMGTLWILLSTDSPGFPPTKQGTATVAMMSACAIAFPLRRRRTTRRFC